MTSGTEGTQRPKVLVIDDEERLCRFLVDGLSYLGCDVVSASTGEAGVELARNERFDVVVCDILMPGSGGIWTLEVIKHHWPGTEVIMMTGYANTESAEACKSLGAFAFLTKPFEIEALRAEIDKAQRTAVPA